jgi:hypothetical protein
MKWDDFLIKIKAFKETCGPGQLNLNAGSLTTLLFAGGFDSMIDKRPLTYKDYHELCEALKQTIGSDAELPGAKKNEALGISDIDSDIKLNMWRYQANPLHRFSLTDHFKGFLEAEGFQKSNAIDKRLIFRRPAPESDSYVEPKLRQRAVEIWSSWKYVFENTAVFKHHSIWTEPSGYKHYPDTKLGFLGMIQGVQLRPLKDGRKSYTFRLFLGGETTDELRVWANEQGFVPHAIRQHLKNGSVGIGIIRISRYNDKPSGSLSEWIPAGKWEST